MVYKSPQYSYRPVFDIEVRILHAVEKHEQVLIPWDKGIKLWVEVFEHCDSDSLVIISGSSHKELMQ